MPINLGVIATRIDRAWRTSICQLRGNARLHLCFEPWYICCLYMHAISVQRYYFFRKYTSFGVGMCRKSTFRMQSARLSVKHGISHQWLYHLVQYQRTHFVLGRMKL